MTEGGGGGRERLFWDFLDSNDSPGNIENLGKKVQDGKGSGGEGGEEAAPPTKKEDRGGVRLKGKESGSEGEEGAAPRPYKKQGRRNSYEKERRENMKKMLANLGALFPAKAKSAGALLHEAVKQIKTLEDTLQSLETQKRERLQCGFVPSIITPQNLSDNSMKNVVFETFCSSNVVLNICGNEAQICVCSAKRPELLTTICDVLEKHKIKVVSAHIASDCNRNSYMIQVQVSGASDQLGTEIYKQAAEELTSWLSP